MRMPKLKTVILSLLLLIVVGAGALVFVINGVTRDRYAGHPQVLGLPPGYNPLAAATPYDGPHPSLSERRPDPYDYPIPIGEPGPVIPTYADSLSYPFVCRTERSELGQPLVDNQDGAGMAVYEGDTIIGYSKDCSINTRVLYYYRNANTGKFLPLTDTAENIEQLSLNGQTVPFVVRLEIGTINRHIYIIAMLRGANDTPTVPDTSLWNGKLLYQMRGGVGIGRRQGRIDPNYIPSRRSAELAQGYAIAHSTANQTSTSYDMQLAEDTLARVKRQFVARYGEPKYTIGLGKSGGAIQQYLIGQNRPGLLDAGIAMYSYPDTVTQISRVMDCELLEYYFDVVDADNEKWQTWSQRSWIQGFAASDDMPNEIEKLRTVRALVRGEWYWWSDGQTECSRSWRNLTPHFANPRYAYFESLFSKDIAERVPFTFWDHQKRVFGTDDYGYGRRTFDNVGVQYGLKALLDGRISIDEFLHINDNIGGWVAAPDMARERFWKSGGAQSALKDVSVWSEHNMTANASPVRPAARNAGDIEAMAAAYQAGAVFLGKIDMPVLDFRHYLERELDMHHSRQSFVTRLRMQRHQGHADNQLIWIADLPYEPFADALDLMERWLDRMHDDRSLSVVDAKPADATDRCYSGDGELLGEGPGVWDGEWNKKADGVCTAAFPPYSNPRMVAGDDYASDILKCHLRSVDQAIADGVYGSINMEPFRDELRRIFPTGVCDYSLGDVARPDGLP